MALRFFSLHLQVRLVLEQKAFSVQRVPAEAGLQAFSTQRVPAEAELQPS